MSSGTVLLMLHEIVYFLNLGTGYNFLQNCFSLRKCCIFCLLIVYLHHSLIRYISFDRMVKLQPRRWRRVTMSWENWKSENRAGCLILT